MRLLSRLVSKVLFALLISTHLFSQTTPADFDVTTFAGSAGGPGIADGIGRAAQFSWVTAMVTAGTDVYAVDYNRIRRISLPTASVSTFVTFEADAVFRGIWSDGTNLYLTDTNCNVRQIAIVSRQVSTIAGNGCPTNFTSGIVDGTGTSARFGGPQSLWGDGNNLYVFDGPVYSTPVIRKIVLSTRAVTTVASFGKYLSSSGSLWGDGSSLWIVCEGERFIRKMVLATGEVSPFAGIPEVSGSTDGSVTTATFDEPSGIWSNGTDLFVTDFSGVRKISLQTNTVSTISGVPNAGAISGSSSHLYIAGHYPGDVNGSEIRDVLYSSGQVTVLAGSSLERGYVDATGTAARFYDPRALSGDASNLYVTDENAAIRKVALTSAAVTTIATFGNDTDSLVASWSDGANLYVADWNKFIRKVVLSTGATSILAGSPNLDGSRDGIGTAARFSGPYGVWGDGVNLYVTDLPNRTIRKINLTSAEVSTVAGNPNADSKAVDGVGAAATFLGPHAIWGNGTNLYILDAGAIRKVDAATATVTTIAAADSFQNPSGLWGDGTNLYVTDENAIRRIVLSSLAVTTMKLNNVRSISPIAIWGNGGALFVTDAYSARIWKLSPTASTELPYSVPARGGMVSTTAGTTPTLTSGYASIQPGAGSTTPAGLAIFGFRQNGVLVTEAGVPASPLIQSGRIFAEMNGPVNTGLALVNPNNQPVSITFYFSDSTGNFGNDTTTIPAKSKIAAFLDESPFNGRTSWSGSFTFSSFLPVSAIALRGLTNERDEFLITTLPVTDLTSGLSAEPLVFSHFADGGGWTTQVVLINPTDAVLSGVVQFRGTSGQVANPGELPYLLPPRASQIIRTPGVAVSTLTGSVRVIPASSTTAPAGVAIFSFRNNGITVTEAGVPAVAAGSAFRMYAESSALIQTGLAVANYTSAAATVTVEVTATDGSAVGLTGTLSVPPGGQVATFLKEISGLTTLQQPFQGVLRISSSQPVSITGLRGRYNERGDFLITTTPPQNESAPVSSSPVYLPHVVDGDGYATQFILISGQGASGTLRFFSQTGTALGFSLR